MHTADMNLKRLREGKHLTQTQLADAIGVTQPTISRAERATPDTKLATYYDIARELGVSLADIFREDERTEEEDALLRRWRSLQADRDRRKFLLLLQLVLDDEVGLGAGGGTTVDPTDT
jgi:transcriptional regulator with XRE-family HTH domain